MLNKLHFFFILILILLFVKKLVIKKYYKPKNPFSKDFDNLLRYWHNLSEKYNINYSISYGTLLGYYRNKNYIPYDLDIDIWIDKKDINKLVNLQESFYTDEKHKNYNGYKLAIYRHHNSKFKNRPIWDKNGKLCRFHKDIYSFSYILGRLIYKNLHIDICIFHKSTKENVKNLIKNNWGINQQNNLLEYTSSKYATSLPKTKITTLNNITTRVISDRKIIKDCLIKMYGKNFYKPDILYYLFSFII